MTCILVKRSQTVVETGLGSNTTRCYLVAQLYPTPLPTPWTLACQAPLTMGFSRQEYWSGLPFPSPGDLPDRGFEPMSPALVGGFFTTVPPGFLWQLFRFYSLIYLY